MGEGLHGGLAQVIGRSIEKHEPGTGHDHILPDHDGPRKDPEHQQRKTNGQMASLTEHAW